jgi:hypothetical protein
MAHKTSLEEQPSKSATNGYKDLEAPEAGPLIADHPLADVIGAFKDDPMLDAMLENIQEHRRQLEREAVVTE